MNRIESGWATVLGYEKVSQISSQKARGIALVSQLGYFSVLNTVIISSQEARKLDSSIMNKEFSESVIDRSFTLDLPILLRTCPVTPRHGILGNKKIVLKRVSELQGACSELAYSMLEYGESEGDIVIQPFVNAAMNFVWTNGHVVIGPDFDGATAGKPGPIHTCPLVQTKFIAALTNGCITMSPSDSPYSSMEYASSEQAPCNSETLLSTIFLFPRIPCLGVTGHVLSKIGKSRVKERSITDSLNSLFIIDESNFRASCEEIITVFSTEKYPSCETSAIPRAFCEDI